MMAVAPPPEAERVFGGALPLAERYAGWLVGAGAERGLIGPREIDRIWPRHLLNSAAVAEYVPPGSGVCDLGSGAGLPGIVLALLRPDCSIVLLEPLLRRATFLEEVVDDLQIPQVSVVRARAEDYARQHPCHDVVVARAVAPLDRLAQWSLPLLRPGGVLLAQKGSAASDELAAAVPVLDRCGAVDRTVLTSGEGDNVTHIVRITLPRVAEDA